jgi:DNA-binding IclR family transcriptional regulator
MTLADEIDRIIARSDWPPPRPSTMFRILALVTGDIAAGRPFPRQIEIARHMHRHESLVHTNLVVLCKLGYIVREGRRWRLHEQLTNWTATDDTYAEMMSRYFSLRRRWQSFR